ncbi:MAG: hypothetical protein EKK33_06650 [Bradyrhizobiaceae bacterium]|nr:MAG: hypothetical protein EKK33_06650 [Bradyrhizobiaceae bacterium]
MFRFRVPELFLGCFLTVAIFSIGMLFAPVGLEPGRPTQSNRSQEPEKPASSKSDPKPFWESATTDPVAAFTLGLVFVGLFQAVLFLVQLRFMNASMRHATAASNAAKDAAQAATEANKLNRDNFIADQRPWLGMTGELKFTRPFSPVNGGYVTEVECLIANFGKSPAFNVQAVAELFVDQSLRVPDFLQKKLDGFVSWSIGSVTFPGENSANSISLSLTDAQIIKSAVAIAGQQSFSPKLWVGICYTSNEGQQHTTSLVYLLGGVLVGMEVPADRIASCLVHCEAT